jgi:NadR type nicotinamide-nucleotide adenylyltransferase
VIRVAVTGSECTGKTTLALALAWHYRTVSVPEFVRAWVDQNARAPRLGDVDAIARGHIHLADSLADSAYRVLFLDTDLLSTWVYSRHYFGDCPPWVGGAVNERAADCYLLCGIDVPWIADGVQRDRAHRRPQMQALFRSELERRGLTFVEVKGLHSERMATATEAVDRLLG